MVNNREQSYWSQMVKSRSLPLFYIWRLTFYYCNCWRKWDMILEIMIIIYFVSCKKF
jgi:hypothetical protein